ncbi:MAG TPA: hypothetical protein VFA67_09730 [Candidatus Sulfotelmatobacter sp.]|nr:hypothetical protein [Candidatus Sulfotelmatobacter sp.]
MKLAFLLLGSVGLSAGLGWAQDADTAPRPGAISVQGNPSQAPLPPLRTTREKWNNFAQETVGPLTWGGGAFNALFSQVTNTDPKYGRDRAALGKRFGASLADIASQNFFGDFAVASAFHEDPRYHRKGEGFSFWYRLGYAISRAAVIRKDNGGNTFNFDNVLGSAASSAFSNIYYPAASRNREAMLTHFWTDVADNGFVNLAPEFWPDFKRKVFGRWTRHSPGVANR